MSWVNLALGVAAALSAAGGAYSAVSAADEASNQKRIINDAAIEADKLQEKKQAITNKFVEETYQPEERQKRFDELAVKNELSLADQLRKSQGGQLGDVKSTAEGQLSSDFYGAAKTASQNSVDDILKRTRLLAKVNAPSLLYSDEGLAHGQLASDLAGYNLQNNRNNRYTNQTLQNSKNNGSLVAGLLSGAGSAVGAGSSLIARK